MSDRSTRSSTRSKQGTGRSNGKHARGRADDQLGDLEFSDWYESQVFEPSSEERFEAMATSGRAPARLIARVVIAAGAKRDRNRGLRNGPVDLVEEKGEPVNRSAEDLTAEPAEAETEPAETSAEETDFADGEEEESETPANETNGETDDDVYDEDDDEDEDDEEEDPEAPAGETDDYEDEEELGDETDVYDEDDDDEEEDPETVVDETDDDGVYDEEPKALVDEADDDVYDEDDEPEAAEPEPVMAEPVLTEPGAPEPLLIPELAERMSFRQKASALLDRWAEKEVAIATKLDDALVPSISWGSRKKPAHSRKNKSG